MFDFKSCLETAIELKLFPGDNLVPVNTTLSNSTNAVTTITALLAPDIVTGGAAVGGVGKLVGSGGIRNKIVHGMAASGTLEVGDAKSNSIAAGSVGR
jgi:hypothetical protein